MTIYAKGDPIGQCWRCGGVVVATETFAASLRAEDICHPSDAYCIRHLRERIEAMERVPDVDPDADETADQMDEHDLGLLRPDEMLGNLLAMIHRDGGHHTEQVGLEQSVEDAFHVWSELQLTAYSATTYESENKRLRAEMAAIREFLAAVLLQHGQIVITDANRAHILPSMEIVAERGVETGGTVLTLRLREEKSDG